VQVRVPPHRPLSVKEKTKLWKRLRDLDRKMSKFWPFYHYQEHKEKEFNKLDLKRKEIRNKLKGYA